MVVLLTFIHIKMYTTSAHKAYTSLIGLAGDLLELLSRDTDTWLLIVQPDPASQGGDRDIVHIPLGFQRIELRAFRCHCICPP